MDTTKLFNTVLLVEDDPGHAQLIIRALKELVGAVIHCTTVAAAQKELRSNLPSLVITDLHLPDSSQAKHIEELKQQSHNAPLIVLTSSTSVQEAVEAMRRGAQDFIVKNFDASFKDVLGMALSRLATALRLEREKEKLQRDMMILQTAIENSNDGLAVIGAGHAVLYSNRAFDAFVEICGGTRKEVLSIFSEQVNQAESLRESMMRNLENLAAGTVWHTEVTFKNKKDKAFDLSHTVIEGQGAQPTERARESVLWVRDISDQKRREKFQREILSTTTHDLKGPLGAIIISSDLLGDLVKDNNKIREIVLRIASSAQGAVNLIDEFLSARRIQEGTFILRPSPQKIEVLIEEVIQDYMTIANARGIKLDFQCERNGSEAVQWRVDKMGLVRVLSNLLSNALKFTQRGGEVHVRAKAVHDDLHIQVEDTGCGMEPSEVQGLFKRFARLDKHNEVGGTGIGLFVVKSIITAHGGKIEVTTKVGQGSTFDLYLPRNPPVNDRGELISLDFT